MSVGCSGGVADPPGNVEAPGLFPGRESGASRAAAVLGPWGEEVGGSDPLRRCCSVFADGGAGKGAESCRATSGASPSLGRASPLDVDTYRLGDAGGGGVGDPSRPEAGELAGGSLRAEINSWDNGCCGALRGDELTDALSGCFLGGAVGVLGAGVTEARLAPGLAGEFPTPGG